MNANLRLVLGCSTPLFLACMLAAPAPSNAGVSTVRQRYFLNASIDGNAPEAGDRFASSVAIGDFNGDGVRDLATGVPDDNGPADLPINNAGAVIVRLSAPGVGPSGVGHLRSLYASGGPASASENAYFGRALAAGDFNADGKADLAVGADWHGLPDCDPCGAVFIYYGDAQGVPEVAEKMLRAGTGGLPDLPSYSFGGALAAGDFDADGYADLAIGAFNFYNGGVIVLHGGAGGLDEQNSFLIEQDDPQIPDDGESPDDFGFALAAGNFNGDLRCILQVCWPYDDLAISAPGEDGIGAVMVLLGSPWSLLFDTAEYYGRGDLGGTAGEADDGFGWSLAAADFDGDSFADLAIGAPHDDLGAGGSIADAGAVTVVYGASGGLDPGRSVELTQGLVSPSPGDDETSDLFGFALAAGDTDRDGKAELAIGHHGEDYSANTDLGTVSVLTGAASGLVPFAAVYRLGIDGVLPGPQDSSDFGRALALGDLDGDAHGDLVIGIPFRDQAGVQDAGAQTILFGALFADGFGNGTTWRWSAVSP